MMILCKRKGISITNLKKSNARWNFNQFTENKNWKKRFNIVSTSRMIGSPVKSKLEIANMHRNRISFGKKWNFGYKRKLEKNN